MGILKRFYFFISSRRNKNGYELGVWFVPCGKGLVLRTLHIYLIWWEITLYTTRES